MFILCYSIPQHCHDAGPVVWGKLTWKMSRFTFLGGLRQWPQYGMVVSFTRSVVARGDIEKFCSFVSGVPKESPAK